jgi:hypothetical protein
VPEPRSGFPLFILGAEEFIVAFSASRRPHGVTGVALHANLYVQ